MKKLFTIVIFPLIIIVLGFFLVRSIMQPVSFEKEKSYRENVAKERLMDIRTLQEGYKSRYNAYAPTMDSLINFYYNDSIAVIRQIGSMDDSVAVAEGRVWRDTINILVRDTLLKHKPLGYSVDSLRYIPFSGKDTVIMESLVKLVSGVNVPLFEACMPYKQLLKGLDEQLIINLYFSRVDNERYPGYKVGSVTTPNNNAGNWE